MARCEKSTFWLGRSFSDASETFVSVFAHMAVREAGRYAKLKRTNVSTMQMTCGA